MAKRIMFQGTGSTVGKSLTVAAICRILSDRGYHVAPFKSQNMALNSYITADGKEMGRAQVVQAEAARIEPSVLMNPILLKPTSHVGSQVILNGKVYKNMKARDYFANKSDLIPYIKEAFNTLNEMYDYIVIEGAGSPAEINLRSTDIVNMGLAEMVDTDVILVGDVDKGGVFAAIYGTYMLLEPEEQKRMKGFMINKFRGDVSLLMPGIRMIEEKIGIPCVGVIPFIEDLKIDDEDSVTSRFDFKKEAAIKIGVVKTPYMSNFSDFTVFDMEEEVSLEYVNRVEDIQSCDMLIIPGSKNTINDMAFLIGKGMSEAIYRFHKSGKWIMGICGGFQMLGKTIKDPSHVESIEETVNGLGLLDAETVMSVEKTTVQNSGQLIIDDRSIAVKGYEIHMGMTTLGPSVNAFIKTADGRLDGAIDWKNKVMGTYFHGIFDNDAWRHQLINQLRASKGLDLNEETISYEMLKSQEYDRLAKVVNDHIEWPILEAILNESRESNC